MRALPFIRKSFALLLVFILLTASTGLDINAHYCKDNLVSISIWGKAKSCTQTPIENKKEKCSNFPTLKTPPKGCCSNKNAFSKAAITTDLSSFQQENISAVVCSYGLPKLTTLAPKIAQQNYFSFAKPPLVKNLSILHQNFRL